MFEVHQGIGLLSKRLKPGILPPGAFEENGQKLIFVEQKRISITSFTEQNKKKIIFIVETFNGLYSLRWGPSWLHTEE